MEPEGDWCGPSGDDAEAGFPESPVITIDELVELFLLLGHGHSVKGAKQKTLEVYDGGVHLWQPFVHLLGGQGARLDLQPLLEIHHACCCDT